VFQLVVAGGWATIATGLLRVDWDLVTAGGGWLLFGTLMAAWVTEQTERSR